MGRRGWRDAHPCPADRQPFGEMIGNDREVRWLHRPEDFVVVKGHGFI
jgi:hypothetical protein